MDTLNIFTFLSLPTTALLFGWVLDLLYGDPICLPHPVVYMGKWIAKGEHLLNQGRHRLLKGALFSVISILLLFFLAETILLCLSWGEQALPQHARPAMEIVSLALQSVSVFFCLAGHTLRKEVSMVFDALRQSIEAGRNQVARIVGRDTQSLSSQEVATASLETLAENLSDGVIAPLFWWAVLGVPGMLTYKMINTFDSMVGYQSPRYKDFGCWAAHIDDIANFIPARITALLLCILGWMGIRKHASLPHRSLGYYFRNTFHFSRCHASPNSGWPEAALSSLLDCRFGGPHFYFGEVFYKPYIGTNPRPLHHDDMIFSVRLCLYAEITAVAIIAALSVWTAL